MTSITFDTLASANRLKQQGIAPAHAEAFARELKAASETDTSHLVTKEQLESSLRELELRMIIKLGAMQFAMLVALGGFIKLFVH